MAKDDVAEIVLNAPAWRPPAFDPADPIDYRLAWLTRNDAGNAERLRQRHGDDLLYVQGVGWHAWDGRRWCGDLGEVEASKRCHATAIAIYDEVSALQDRDEPRAPNDLIDAHWKWAAQSGNAQRLRAMLTVAQPYMTALPGEMDRHGRLLNLRNGTLLLDHPAAPPHPDDDDRRGACEELRPHNRGDRLTRLIDIDWDPEASCPLWDRFLRRVVPDEEVRLFLQRSVGYSMTGDTGEQCLWFLHGSGANGKSTFVNIVARLLGPYAATLNFSSLVLDDRKRGGEPTPDLARLPGVRFVRASEPEQGVKLGEGHVKSLTGGEPITVRNLNQPFFELVPEFKLWLSGNHKPRIRGQDEGVWRRIRLVPWTVSIPPEERDQHLEAKLWAERAGILNWALDGVRMWLDGGLRPPVAVLDATAEYREDQDPLGIWLAQETEPVEGSNTQATRLYAAYRRWCGENAVEPMSTTLFGRMLTERGYSKIKSGIVHYRGIQLTDEASAALDRRESARRSGDD